MKKLSTLMMMLFLGIGLAHAEKVDDKKMYRGYSNSFIFLEGGVEFAVFPDGQFDFNFLDSGPQFGANVNFGNVNVSFNTGYNYDPFVQYDTYGAVIQIENTPIFYDPYGRIIQAGDVVINYRNGFVHNVGNLYVNYRQPGIILNYTGFINNYNRGYVYRPWHQYYAAPVYGRAVVYNTAYRTYYNPVRFSYSYHRNYWNTPSYYNGCYVNNRSRRHFYRPNDRVNYRDFERGNRDSRGRIASNGRNKSYRKNLSNGRESLQRSSERRGEYRQKSNRSMATRQGRVANNRNGRATNNVRNKAITSRSNRAGRTASNGANKNRVTRTNQSSKGRTTGSNRQNSMIAANTRTGDRNVRKATPVNRRASSSKASRPSRAVSRDRNVSKQQKAAQNSRRTVSQRTARPTRAKSTNQARKNNGSVRGTSGKRSARSNTRSTRN